VNEFASALNQARKELAELVFEQQNLLLVVGPNLEARFLARLGGLELELLQQQIENRRLIRQIELCRAALNQQQSLPREAIVAQLEEELADWRRQLRERQDKIQGSQSRLKKLLTPESSAAVRTLYRQLVKRLHPDLHPHPSERQKELWYAAQQAYQLSDWARMETLLAVTDEEWDETPEELARMRSRCADLRDDIGRLRQQYPHNVAERLQDEEWIRGQEGQLKLRILLERQRTAKLQAVLQEFW
jgi:hypothetical protein